ncbi:MAG: 50S ribosomal protein L11 methyltransferase [Deltaproteobacteria bacterium]|jgi:ribosomal protein L11 methyltransferase|nr:50S ribosomal protein L11 methyltransferase [Deltaproteobacteria bacterium]
MSDWLLVTLTAPPFAGEAAGHALFEAGAGGVWEEAPDEKGRLVLKAGFAEGDEMRLMAELPGALGRMAEALELPLGDFSLTMELRPGEDFSESWKKDLRPVVVSPELVVRPSWWEDDIPGARPDAKILRLDPGSAFGSGHHASTYLCLVMLDALAADGYRPNDVLDLGAGSGILALSAALLFDKAKIRAVDNDPETEFAIGGNLAANGLQNRIRPEIATLGDADGEFDLVMANLTRNALMNLSKTIAAHSRLPGRLILSGILAGQTPEILKSFGDRGFVCVSHLGLNDWSALCLARGADVPACAGRVVLQSSLPDEFAAVPDGSDNSDNPGDQEHWAADDGRPGRPEPPGPEKPAKSRRGRGSRQGGGG